MDYSIVSATLLLSYSAVSATLLLSYSVVSATMMLSYSAVSATLLMAHLQQMSSLIYASETNMDKYIKIADHLPGKTVRDVAFRIKWIIEKEIMKKDKMGSKKLDDDKSNIFLGSINSHETDSYKATLGVVGELLEENNKISDQITSNFSFLEIHTNSNLLSQIRNNIFKMFSYMDEDIEIMKNLPPIPDKINIDVANLFLGPS
ncbi:uncharacterized protein LOC124913028 [Impatiens glandulifera]|uniref:uncharacterized protein LOC124913028 n=1 Tax=Impatiens glandulifera TaxID=253017 RepID=UPI001FB0841C|nr:uncharacterized protein LOC124913028 [Impatiens glandulifera]